jgi:hypothetical protein
MCPMCWAAALTYFAGFAAFSLVAVAGRDKWTLFAGIPTAILSVLRGWQYVSVPWWVLLLLLALLLGRLAFLAFKFRTRLRSTIWQQAQRSAKRSCPNRQAR